MSENDSHSCETPSTSPSGSHRSLCSADFADLLDEADSEPAEESASATDDACPHPGYLAGMCIRCGAEKETTEEPEGSLLSFKYLHSNLELSKEEAQRLSEMRTAQAEAAGKLQLVLDLDHTLLHSIPVDVAVSLPNLREWLQAEFEAEHENPLKRRTLYEVPLCNSLTKLRPGVFSFLQSLSELYEMHIYTNGEAVYAAEMAKLLDPDGRLFHRKVISREHSSTPMAKSLDIVMGDDHSTVIVDDTWQVWTHHVGNLLEAAKYMFFPVLSFDWHLGRPWLERLADECSSTGELSRIQSQLKRIHTAYFAMDHERRDVRSVIRTLSTRKRGRSDG